MADANGSGDYRITLALVYTRLEEQSRMLASMDTRLQLQDGDLKRMAADMSSLKRQSEDQAAMHAAELDKMRSRINGILIGVGSGLLVGVPALIGLLR